MTKSLVIICSDLTYRKRDWLKFIITSNEQTIELKGYDTFQVKNFMNLILYTNNVHPILVEDKDRRFNIIRNEKANKLIDMPFYESKKHIRDKIECELEEFSKLLLNMEYDEEAANTPLETEAKDRMKEFSVDVYEEFVEALKNKDSEYFLLREIFPPNPYTNLIEKAELSDDGQFCEKVIKEGYIPAKFMHKILDFHIKEFSYKKTLAKLKMYGLENKTERLVSNFMQPMSVYGVKQ